MQFIWESREVCCLKNGGDGVRMEEPLGMATLDNMACSDLKII